MPPRPVIERLLGHGVRDVESGCLLYDGFVDPVTGYARIKIPDGGGWRNEYVHRVAYEHFVGPIPEGHEIDHVRKRGCVHRHCFEWTHLEAVTPMENQHRGDAPAATRAAHAAQTHCRRAGHELTPENTYRLPNRYQTRACRECKREANRRHKSRKRAQPVP